MKNTIPAALSDREIKSEKELVEWANRELRPVVRQARAVLNNRYDAVFELSTAGTGAFTNIWTSDAMPTGSAWLVVAHVIAYTTSGTAQRGAYIRRGLFYNDAGTVAQQGTTVAEYTEESAAGADVRLQVSGQTIQLDVQDDGVSTFSWRAFVTVYPTREA